ncbi:MAG TPA: CHAT domain-containing protein, partial [Pyrinomonadaceae bacterium]
VSGLASCFSPGGQGGGDQPGEPPPMGRAPDRPDGVGRADVRVFDADGNPVKDAKAELSSKRPNGFSCDSGQSTDAAGRALLPPLHVGKLKLSIAANGFQTLEAAIEPGRLAEPVRVVLSPKGAQAASRLAQAKGGTPSPARCFDLYRLLDSYLTGELGRARANYLGGRFDDANKHFVNLLAAAGDDSPAGKLARASRFRAAARTGLGDVAYSKGDYAAALRLYTEAVGGASKDRRHELMWAAQRGIGRTLWTLAGRENSPPEAARLRAESLKAYEDSIKTVETLLAGSLRSDEARTSFLALTKDVFDEASGAYAELALAATPPSSPVLDGPALTKAAAAFRIAEQGRARSLLELLSETGAELTEGIPAELLRRRSDIQARRYEIVELLNGVDAEGVTPGRPAQALESELRELELARIGVENQIRTSSPRYEALTKPQPLSVEEVQQNVLDADTVLLEYSLGEERSYLWAVTGTGVRLFRLPARSEVETLVAEFRAKLIPRDLRRPITETDANGATREQGRGLVLAHEETPQRVGAYAAAAHALYKAVVEPASSLVGGKRLLVVADGALHYAPFGALVTSAEGSTYDALPYLLKTNEVVYAPSASVVAAVRRQAAGGATGNGVLLIADPVFDAGDPRASRTPANPQGRTGSARPLRLDSALEDVTRTPPGGLRLARLPGSRTEAEQVAKLARASGRWPDELLDSSASKTNLLSRDLTRYCILHFATHGLLNAERPQFTGLALSPVWDSEDDGFLKVDEIFNLRLGSPLVMLSACETGLGKQSRGEGVVGLARAFMHAGAPTVGVSLWSVADLSTAELMPEFYKHLLTEEPASPSSALRAAQLTLIEGKRFSAPFHWAAFVLVGDWRRRSLST